MAAMVNGNGGITGAAGTAADRTDIAGGTADAMESPTGAEETEIMDKAVNTDEAFITEEEAQDVLHLQKKTSSANAASVMPLDIWLEITDYENGIVTAVLHNQSGYTMTYGDDYGLEQLIDETWTPVEPVRDYAWTDIAHEIADLEDVTLTYDLTVFGNLGPGTYRLTKIDLSAEFVLE